MRVSIEEIRWRISRLLSMSILLRVWKPCRQMMRLTEISPTLVHSILDGPQPKTLSLLWLKKKFSAVGLGCTARIVRWTGRVERVCKDSGQAVDAYPSVRNSHEIDGGEPRPATGQMEKREASEARWAG